MNHSTRKSAQSLLAAVGMLASVSMLSGCPGPVGPEGPSASYVVPRWTASTSSIASTPGFDTQFVFFYGKDLKGFEAGKPFESASHGVDDGAPVFAHLYLLGPQGAPLENSLGVQVCNPCTYELGPDSLRSTHVSVTSLLNSVGDFTSSVQTGSAVVGIENAADGEVLLRTTVVHSPRQSPFDLEFLPMESHLLSSDSGS